MSVPGWVTMIYFWASLSVPLVSPNLYHTTAMSDKIILTSATKSEHSRRKVLFSDMWSFFHSDKYPWFFHPKVLIHSMISGSILQSTFTDKCWEPENSIVPHSIAKWHCTKILNCVSWRQMFCYSWQTLHLH